MNQYQRIYNILVEKGESGKYPNMVLRDGKWIVKPEKPKKWKGSSKTSEEFPNKVLIDGKWVVKPDKK